MITKRPYFLEIVADRVLALQEKYERCAVVFPNQRPAVFLRKHIAKRIQQPIFLPDVLTLEELLNDVAGLIKQDFITQLFQLYDAHISVAENDQVDTFDEYLGWGRTFIADCNDIDNAMANPATFFNHLYEDKRVRNWTPGEDNTPLQRSYLQFWKEAEQLYHAFTARLQEIGGGYVGFNYRKAVAALEAGKQLDYDYVIFAGFNALNTAEERAIDLITTAGRGEVMWDMDSYYASAESEVYKAGNYYRKYKDRWPRYPDELNANMGYQETSIKVIESPNNTAQCDIAYRILQEKLSQGEIENPSEVAIILCDENLLEPMLLRLPEQIAGYNVTMGKSLNTFGLYHLFDKLMNVFLEKNEEGYLTEVLLNLAATPEMAVLDDQGSYNVLQKEIITNNIYRLGRSFTDTAKVSDIWKRIFSTAVKPVDVIKLSRHIIDRLRAKAEENSDRKMKEVLFEFRNLFIQLENSISDYPAVVDLRSLKKLYKVAAMQIKLPFEGEPISGVQIMGLLESRLLDFDHVILLSANEGVLPESKHSNSSIPYIFRKYYKMPVYHERDAIFAYSFYRLLHHVSQMDIIYNGATASIGSNEKSRYVQQLEAEYAQRCPYDINIYQQTYGYILGKVDEVDYRINKSQDVIDAMLHYFRNRYLSATSIELLIRSPLDFYFRYVLGYRKPRELETDFEANTFGTVVHETLNALYDKYVGVKLTEEILDEMAAKVNEEITTQIQRVFKNGETRYGYNHLLVEAAQVMIKEVIKLDKQRVKAHDIVLIENEMKVTSTFNYPYKDELIPIKVKGSIDRVQTCDGVVEIIDYKTGKIDALKGNNVKEAGEKHTQKLIQQLLTYVYMFQQSTKEYGLDEIRPAILGLRSWQEGLSFIDDPSYRVSQDAMDNYIHNVIERIDELLDPSIPLKPESVNEKIKYSDFLGVWGLA